MEDEPLDLGPAQLAPIRSVRTHRGDAADGLEESDQTFEGVVLVDGGSKNQNLIRLHHSTHLVLASDGRSRTNGRNNTKTKW